MPQQTPEIMQDILDIKAPLAPPPLWWPWLLGGALLLLTGLLCWYFWKRRRPKPPPPPRPAHELALEGVAALEKGDELTDREYYYRLSALFRGYLEARFLFPALEMTTEELLPLLERRDLLLSGELRQETGRLLRRADPVKYAGRVATREMRRQDLETVRSLVQATLPVETEGAEHV